MEDNSLQAGASSLVEQALHHVVCLSNILDQLFDSSNPSDSFNAKKEHLSDLTKMIKQWEDRNLPVPDEFRLMQMNLSSELDSAHEKASSLERIKAGIQEALYKFPVEKHFVERITRKRQASTKKSYMPKTGSKIFRDLILTILRDFGGSASSLEVKAEIEKKLAGKFTDRDLEYSSNGLPVWWAAAHWERLRMVGEGVLISNSPKGLWELAKEV